jgi:hypothetical protein
MKNIRNAILIGVVCTAPLPAAARNEQKLYSIKQALNSDAALGKLDPGIRIFFGKESHPKVTKDFGVWKTNKKTSSFARPDKQACEWVFLSAIIALQKRAQKEGANAIINISSNYENIETSSESEYVCGSGGLISGVAFKGRAVRLGPK